MTDLERLSERALRTLTTPSAPDTLLPRVMAAVREWPTRPLYTRAWFTWPAGWQVAALAVLSTGLWIGWHASSVAEGAAVANWPVALSHAAASTSAVLRVWFELSGAAAVLLRNSWMGPVLIAAGASALTVFAVCVAACAALNHVLWEGTYQ